MLNQFTEKNLPGRVLRRVLNSVIILAALMTAITVIDLLARLPSLWILLKKALFP